MEHNYLLYLASFSIAFGVTLFITPKVKRLAIRWGAIAYPKSRGMHSEPIPQMGGLAIICGFMVSILLMIFFVDEFRTTQFAGFLGGAALIVILGILDDIYILSAKLKMAVQIVAALIAISTGTVITAENVPFPEITSNLLAPLTLVWIVGLTNAVNWIDGLDGLAAGVSSIGSLCLTGLCLMTGHSTSVVFTSIIAGSCLGFLPRNFSPAEIIMGDTGSTFLGYVLAVSSIQGVYKNYAILSVVLTVLALALPIIDTTVAMIRRAIHGKPIYMPDKGHLHHRLIGAGLTTKQAVVLLYALSAVAAITAIVIATRDYKVLLVMLLSLLFFLLLVFFYRKRLSRGK